MRYLRAARVPLIALAVLAASSCSDSEGGTPETSRPSTSAAPETSEQNGATNGASALADLDPCSLLTEEEVAQHAEVKAPQRKTVGNSPTCAWPADAGDTAAFVPTPSVAIRTTGGVNDMNAEGEKVQRTTEGGRDYARVAGYGNCTIGIGVTESTRVDILVTGADTSEEACELANTLTEIAEPRVPRG